MKPSPFFHPSFRGTFGVARRDITPPVGIYSRNWGAALTETATSVHRPFTLTVLTIAEEAEGDPLAIISLDLGWWRTNREEEFLAQAVSDAGISPGRFLLALSHTHSGPVFCAEQSEKPGGEWIASYLDLLTKQIREALAEALTQSRPGLLEVASGSCRLATKRDLPDPEAKRLLVGWNPELPADDTLLIGRVSDDEGNCLATILNYACHPTILAWENTTLSPDFVGAMREVVEKDTKAPCLFLQGASGELAPRHQYVADPGVADQAGKSLGHAALSVLYGMLPPGNELAYHGAVESGASLAIWAPRPRSQHANSITVKSIPIQHPLKSDLLSVEEIQAQMTDCRDSVLTERLQRRLLHRRSMSEGDSETRIHHLWRLGEIFFVSVPDEAYSELQMTLRETLGAAPLFIATLTNGSRGYLAPQALYQANSYASDQSPFAEGCFERTVECLRAELSKLS